MASPREDDLTARLDRLERDLEALRRDLLAGPGGDGPPVTRPPSPRSILRFVDEFAIPTAIAVLEVNVKLLKLAQGSIRLLDTREGVSSSSERLSSAGKSTLARLDEALVELERTVLEGPIPTDQNAARIVEDARAIRREIADRLDVQSPEDRRIEVDADDQDDVDKIGIDVEAELDSIRAELEGDDDDDDDEDLTDAAG